MLSIGKLCKKIQNIKINSNFLCDTKATCITPTTNSAVLMSPLELKVNHQYIFYRI